MDTGKIADPLLQNVQSDMLWSPDATDGTGQKLSER